ncbi:MAG: hypothetical protein AB4062_16795 [Crocosphaera sp.]
MQKAALILAISIIPMISTPASAQVGEIFKGIGTIIEGIERAERDGGMGSQGEFSEGSFEEPPQPQSYPQPQGYPPQGYSQPQGYPPQGYSQPQGYPPQLQPGPGLVPVYHPQSHRYY